MARVRPASGPTALSEAIVPYSWVILAISLAVQTASSFANQSISPLAPFFQGSFQISRAEVGLISTATFGGAFAALTAGGRLSDLFGVRRLFVGGLVALAVFTGLASFTSQFWLLLVCLFLAGFGNGLSLPPTTRAIMFWFPQRVRGIAMSIKQTGVALAGALTGATLPAIALQFGWNGALFAVSIACLIVAAFALIGYRESAGERLARSGSAGAGAGRMVDLLRHPGLLWLMLVSFGYAVVQLSTVNFLVLFLQESLALAVIAAGFFLSLAQSSGVIARIGWGVVSDLVFGGRRKIVLGIIGGCTVGALILLAWLPRDAPGWLIGLLMIAIGASAIGWNGISITYVAEIAGRERSATAAGLNLTASYLGILVGPPLFGLIVDRTESYAVGFQALAAVMVLAIALLQLVQAESHDAIRA